MLMTSTFTGIGVAIANVVVGSAATAARLDVNKVIPTATAAAASALNAASNLPFRLPIRVGARWSRSVTLTGFDLHMVCHSIGTPEGKLTVQGIR
jgi:hypothetical protein